MQQTPSGSDQPNSEPSAPFGGSVNPDPAPQAPRPPQPPHAPVTPPPPPPPGAPMGGSDVPPPSPPPAPTAVANHSLNPKLVIGIIVVVLALVGIAAWFLFMRQPAPQPVVIPQPSLEPTPSPSASLNPTDQVALLVAEPGITGQGEASRSVAPGRFIMTVTAALPDPESGKFYEVWLIKPQPVAQFSAGQLKKSGDRWVMTLDQTRDASTYVNVMVTLETVDDKQPETKVLTGSFQQ